MTPEALNTTIRNRTKHRRLSAQHVIPTHHVDGPDVPPFLQTLSDYSASKEQLLFSIGVALLDGHSSPAIERFYEQINCRPIEIQGIPHGAFDLLGSVYQFLNSKSENLERGCFYTGRDLALDLVADLDFGSGQSLFDPACGSGSFLFHSSAGPDQIFGVDSDPLAIMIAKFNYFLKFPDADDPHLYCADFLEWSQSNATSRFTYVIGNPPFGANVSPPQSASSSIQSGESFSYFTEFAHGHLADGGLLRFLVPEALLNVKRHTDIRKVLLDKANLRRIKRYSAKFAGVMSDVYMIEVDTGNESDVLFEGKQESRIPKRVFRDLKNCIFVELSSLDLRIIEKVKSAQKYDLSSSIFALGVVTGDNESKLLPMPRPGAEPIYTGKEVQRYELLPPTNHIRFDRESLQQVAPDECYRAPKKLIYKVICKELRFALDATGALTTNSANILIPQVPGYDIESVMAMLNTRLYSFLYKKLFGGVNKIGKEHLIALPFPYLAPAQNAELAQIARDAALSGDHSAVDEFVTGEVFRLPARDVEAIQRETSR